MGANQGTLLQLDQVRVEDENTGVDWKVWTIICIQGKRKSRSINETAHRYGDITQKDNKTASTSIKKRISKGAGANALAQNASATLKEGKRSEGHRVETMRIMSHERRSQ
jgi:hypothetical protein